MRACTDAECRAKGLQQLPYRAEFASRGATLLRPPARDSRAQLGEPVVHHDHLRAFGGIQQRNCVPSGDMS